jgi:plastocyanin
MTFWPKWLRRHANVVLTRTLLLAVVGIVGLSACGDSPGNDPPVVQMFDNRFAPASITVEAGTTVDFPNEGRVNHNVIDADGSFDSREPAGLDQKAGETWAYTFAEQGTYSIYCSLHAVMNKKGEWEGMVAEVNVVPAASP